MKLLLLLLLLLLFPLFNLAALFFFHSLVLRLLSSVSLKLMYFFMLCQSFELRSINTSIWNFQQFHLYVLSYLFCSICQLFFISSFWSIIFSVESPCIFQYPKLIVLINFLRSYLFVCPAWYLFGHLHFMFFLMIGELVHCNNLKPGEAVIDFEVLFPWWTASAAA